MNEKSIRTTLDERKSTYVTDMRKQSLFDLVDSDNSGTIDKKEFGQLYDIVKEQVHTDLSAKMQMEEKATRAKRKAKLFAFIGGLLLTFLLVSIGANSALVFYMLEASKEVKTTADGMLTNAHNSSELVKISTAEMNMPIFLLPRLGIERVSQVKTLTLAACTTINAEVCESQYYKHFRVESFDWWNNFTMKLYSSRGDTISIYAMSVMVEEAALRAQHPEDPTKYQWQACGSTSAACSSVDIEVDSARLLDDFFEETGTDKASDEAVEMREGLTLGPLTIGGSVDTNTIGDEGDDESRKLGFGCRRELSVSDIAASVQRRELNVGWHKVWCPVKHLCLNMWFSWDDWWHDAWTGNAPGATHWGRI